MATDDWEPSASDLAWCRNLLALCANGAVWATSNGIYKVDHTKCELTLVARPPWFFARDHARNVLAFGMLGYRVLDATSSVEDGRAEPGALLLLLVLTACLTLLSRC